jgi:hypothetical protein
MTRASELRALADRVEAAKGADRMLDLDVWRAVCPGAAELEARGKQPLPWLWCVTDSLDAAASLVPAGGGVGHRQQLFPLGNARCEVRQVLLRSRRKPMAYSRHPRPRPDRRRPSRAGRGGRG